MNLFKIFKKKKKPIEEETTKCLTDDYFWNMVDMYESESKGKVKPAIGYIIRAYEHFDKKFVDNVDEAIADYELLTGLSASKFVQNSIRKAFAK